MKTLLEQFPISNKNVNVIVFCNGVEGIVFSEFEKLIDDSNTFLSKKGIKTAE